MPGDVKPEAPGVYEREYPEGEILLCKFSDGDWYVWESTPERAANADVPSCDQSLPWRGQIEYDPHNAPDGFVAVLNTKYGCDGCECGSGPDWKCDIAHCTPGHRVDSRDVIMKRAKP